jgi:hypothetical protein
MPDKPGTFRIRPGKHGGKRLSGVRLDGRRVRLDGLSDSEADRLANELFPKPAQEPEPVQPIASWDQVDDWGFPKISDDTLASVNKTMGVSPDGQAVKKEEPKKETPEEIEKRERRAKNAKGLMDLVSVAGSAGLVMVSRRITEAADKEPVKPDPKQVNDFRDNLRETLTDMFGERGIPPWQMTILLLCGIPISMLLQSPRKKKIEESEKPTQASSSSGLKSVP